MVDLRLYLLQRGSALIMIPLVFCHIALMIYAVQDGLSAAEILGRTRGSVGWALFYGIFVVAVSVHSTIGMRTIMFEWAGVSGRLLNLVSWCLFLGLLLLGSFAVYGVTTVPDVSSLSGGS